MHCSITGWGPVGPLAEVPGYDAAVAARSGRMMAFERQLRRGGPVFAAVPVAAHVAAHGAVQGIVAGLFARARGGGGQRVETSLLQGVLPFDLVELLLVEMAERSGMEAPNITTAGGDMPTLNYHPVRTKDGRWIQCGNLLEHLLLAFLDATDLLGELLVDDRFAAPPGSVGRGDRRRRARPHPRAHAGAHGRTSGWTSSGPTATSPPSRTSRRPRRSTTPTSSATATSSRSTTRCTARSARSARSPS